MSHQQITSITHSSRWKSHTWITN